jgi:hypothetical protein
VHDGDLPRRAAEAQERYASPRSGGLRKRDRGSRWGPLAVREVRPVDTSGIRHVEWRASAREMATISTFVQQFDFFYCRDREIELPVLK